MFQLLQPIWLFATAGISIPVIIHLWNTQPGKIRKIGSIALLTASLKQSTRSVKISDLLLLLLRCLLILLVSFVLAKPLWKYVPGTAKQKGWVLMDKQNLRQTYAQFRPLVDSLLASGFEFHDFNRGFEKEKLAEALETSNDTISANPASYWNLMAALNEQIPVTLPMHLFTGSNLKNFRGRRPAASANINWHTFKPADSAAVSIKSAYLISSDSTRIVMENSKPSGTFYTYHDLAIHALPENNFQIVSRENKSLVSFDGSRPVSIDTSTIRISIFSDKYFHDAGYLGAAIEAIQQFSKRKIKLSVIHTVAEIPLKQDWLFWISDLPVKTNDEPGKIFMYEKGKEQAVRTWITAGNMPLAGEQLSVYKYIRGKDTGATAAQTIWEDGFGHPLLTLENKNSTPVYHFFSRFDPAWNDLPWSSRFPALIYKLIADKEENAWSVDSSDRRMIDRRQLQPAFKPAEKSAGQQKRFETIDLGPFFWAAIFILFFIERFISFQNKKWRGNG